MFTIDEYLAAKTRGERYAGSAASPRTIENYRYQLKRAEDLVGRPLCQFDDTTYETLVAAMDRANFAPNSRALMLAALRGIFKWAIGRGKYEGVHPFEGIMVPKAPRELPHIFSDEELKTVFDSLENEKYKLFFSLMYFCGMRIGEVRTLRKDALRQTANGSAALVVLGKGNVERFIPIPSFVAESLRRFMAAHPFGEYVFYNESSYRRSTQPVSTNYAYQLFRELKKELNLPEHARPHNFRATSATKMHAASGDLAVTQRFLGHKRPETTMLYAQIADKRLQDVSEQAFSEI